MEKEEFLMRLTGSEDEEAASTPRLQYYNKVTSPEKPGNTVVVGVEGRLVSDMMMMMTYFIVAVML